MYVGGEMKFKRGLVIAGMAVVLTFCLCMPLFMDLTFDLVVSAEDENHQENQEEQTRIFEDETTAYTNRGPIHVTSDSDFHSQASANGWNVDGRDGFSSEKAYLIRDYNIQLTAAWKNPAITIENTDLYFIIANNSMTTCYNTFANGIASTDSPHCVSIEGNIIETAYHGIFMRNSDNAKIWNNDISTCYESGMRICSNYINITENSITDVRYNAIWLENAEYCNVTKNEITKGTSWNPPTYEPVGIFLDGQARMGLHGYGFTGDVIGNTVSRNNITGLSCGIMLLSGGVFDVSNNIISMNRLIGSTQAGIGVSGGSLVDANQFSKNNITEGLGLGIYLDNSWGNFFIDNLISGNNKSGIYMYASQQNEFLNNTIIDNGEQGIEFLSGDSSNSNSIKWNLIMNNSMNGISLIDWYHDLNTIEHNTIHLNNGSGIYISSDNGNGVGNIIRNNTISQNKNRGISIEGFAAGFSIQNNTISGHLNAGIYLQSEVDDLEIFLLG